MAPTKDIYMVIGGNGFLGRHIVQQLLNRGDIVSVFDIVERYSDVSFYSGDITDQDSVASALRKVRLQHVLRPSRLIIHDSERDDLYYTHRIAARNNKQPSAFSEGQCRWNESHYSRSRRNWGAKTRLYEFSRRCLQRQ